MHNFVILQSCLQCRRGIAMRKLSAHVRLSVCPSLCLSVKRVDCDKTEERSVQIFIYYTHLAQFSEKKNGWWEATPST